MCRLGGFAMVTGEFLESIGLQVDRFLKEHGQQVFGHAWPVLNENEERFVAAVRCHDEAIINVARKDQYDPKFQQLVVSVATVVPVKVVFKEE